MIKLIIIICSVLYAEQADHLLLSRIVTQGGPDSAPDAGESFSIYNPTSNSINLKNYYICDDENYYKMQTEDDLAPSNSIFGFTAKFPDIEIASKDTLTIVFHENYNDYYDDSFTPDLVMYTGQPNSLIETTANSFGSSLNGLNGGKLENTSELLILFYWDGNENSLIQDVDYFIWGNYHNKIDKSELDNYNNDTDSNSQFIFEEEAKNYYAYARLGDIETDEIESNGNGITGNDETSENLSESWSIIEMFNLGCTEPDAPNYDESAIYDDGSCYMNFKNVIDDLYDCNLSSQGYCDSDPSCPEVLLKGIIVDYFDITIYGGPHAITLEDENGYRLEITIWPDQWDIASDIEAKYLISAPYNRYLMEAKGSVFEYNGEKQVLICSQDDFFVLESWDQYGIYKEGDFKTTKISPAPYVIIPTLGETLDFNYSFTGNSRVIIRIIDISGRFITSLVDKYYISAGTVTRDEQQSAWDGRDHLGQIVSPGTYILHIETLNPVTGETHTDAAPIVVGVKN